MQLPDHSGCPRQATKESDLASACQSANPTPHYDKRFDPFPPLFGGKRTLQAPASVRSADCGRAHFTLRGYMAENGSRGLREEHGDD